jgi:hypothetical protein
MKPHLRGGALRFRLTQQELASLRDQGWWQGETTLGPLGGPRLAYRVEIGEGPKPGVRFATGFLTVVTVVLPAADVAAWAGSSEVGVYFDEPWGLKVSVEKDFRCLDPRRDEDESDNFENPKGGEASHTECPLE